MNKKAVSWIVIGIIIVAVIVVGVVAYWALTSSGGGGGGEETVYNLGNATSVQFDVNLTIPGEVGIYNFACKNLNSTSDLMLRVDANPVVGAGTVYSYIFYAGNETTVNNSTGTWAAGDFTTDWPTWSTQFFGYLNHNKSWMTGDGNMAYTDADGNDVLIYNIVLNPTLSDSLFQSP